MCVCASHHGGQYDGVGWRTFDIGLGRSQFVLIIIITMLCSLSGEVAREPVLSTKSGHIFEKSLLAKHLSRDPRDPITNEPMVLADDTVAVQTTNEIVCPRPSANSLPGMIQSFQDEWDALMLETY